MIIDGKKIAEEMLAEVAEEVKKLPKKPRLAAIFVEPSHLEAKLPSGQPLEVEPLSKEAQPRLNGTRKFLELKKKAAEKVGIDFRFYEFPAEITTQKLRKEIVRISKAAVNQGVIIELPLPKHLNTQYLLNAIPPDKDVDVLSERAQGAFFVGRSSVLPPAVEAVKTILEKHSINPRGKNCAIFGYGLLVGRQVAHWLASGGATVSVINEHTSDPAYFSSRADIVVSGVGPIRDKDALRALAVSNGASKPDLITADMVKEGAAVIDFGKDIDFESVSKKAGLVTPPVGGVGPIVVAAVLSNLIKLFSRRGN